MREQQAAEGARGGTRAEAQELFIRTWFLLGLALDQKCSFIL